MYRARDLRVGVGSLAASESSDDVDEATVELDPPLATTGLLLLLFGLLDLGGLSLDLTGTSQRSVHLTSDQQHVVVQLHGGQGRDQGLALQRGSLAGQADVLGIASIDSGQLDLQEGTRAVVSGGQGLIIHGQKSVQ